MKYLSGTISKWFGREIRYEPNNVTEMISGENIKMFIFLIREGRRVNEIRYGLARASFIVVSI